MLSNRKLKKMRRRDLERENAQLKAMLGFNNTMLEEYKHALKLIDKHKEVRPECAGCAFAVTVKLYGNTDSLDTWVVGCTKTNFCKDFQPLEKKIKDK